MLRQVEPHRCTRWIVRHRAGCICGQVDGECDCWPEAQCADCERHVDVGEWEWSAIDAGALAHLPVSL